MYQYPTNLKKYPGSLLFQKNKIIFKVTQKNNPSEFKEFPFTQNNKEAVTKEAEDYKRQWGIQNEQVKNKYYLEGTDLYVDLGGEYFVTDQDKLSQVDQHTWYLIHNKSGKYVVTTLPKKKDKKREILNFSHFITGEDFAEHINQDALDNRMANLKTFSDPEEQAKIFYFNRKKRKDNTSGFTGVYHGANKKYEYWEVKGYDYHDKKIYKKFGIHKYGNEGAYSMACDYRDKHINQDYQKKLTAT